ncbi:MAG TPA: 50S ribosomal protein L2 [Candidatus Nanoarchaeia archaeon]|nr:50S ribosomal protein L2 [Candidatus Nanoarchaeia archaeon]
MGKNITQQKRGKGSPVYKKPSFRFLGKVQYGKGNSYLVQNLQKCPIHTAPLAQVKYDSGEEGYLVAPEGIRIGDKRGIGSEAEIEIGSILPLKDIPEGVTIFNIESHPGDGGKFVRASGLSARIVGKTPEGVRVLLPSRVEKIFHPDCRATLGTIAGSGRPEKPFLKAGTKYHLTRAKHQYWPSVSGISMNAVAHPFGKGRSSKKGRPTIAPKDAPPGKKVGKLRPRKTGRGKSG